MLVDTYPSRDLTDLPIIPIASLSSSSLIFKGGANANDMRSYGGRRGHGGPMGPPPGGRF